MKKIAKFTCLAVGAALVATASIASAGTAPGCCGAAMPMADQAKSDAKAKPYPLDTCVVSGEKLGEMGKAYAFDYQGQEVKLCCKKCKAKFDKDPAAYMKKIATAEANQ